MRMRIVLQAVLMPSLFAVSLFVSSPFVSSLVAAAPTAPTPPAAPAELTRADATGVLGRMVIDDGSREIGRIVDVVVDPSGQPRAVVVDVGGFMGVGSRRVAVAWSAVHVPPPGASDARVTIDMTDEQIRNAPAYTDRSKPATIVGPAAAPAAGPAEPEAEPPASAPSAGATPPSTAPDAPPPVGPGSAQSPPK